MPVTVQRTERSNYYVQLRRQKIGFRSPRALYDSIKRDLGVVAVTQRNSDAVVYGVAGATLPRLALKLSGGGANNTGIANQAQSDGNDSCRVFVDPGKIEHCLDRLIGRTTRGKRISGVKIPKRRVYI